MPEYFIGCLPRKDPQHISGLVSSFWVINNFCLSSDVEAEPQNVCISKNFAFTISLTWLRIVNSLAVIAVSLVLNLSSFRFSRDGKQGKVKGDHSESFKLHKCNEDICLKQFYSSRNRHKMNHFVIFQIIWNNHLIFKYLVTKENTLVSVFVYTEKNAWLSWGLCLYIKYLLFGVEIPWFILVKITSIMIMKEYTFVSDFNHWIESIHSQTQS